MTDLTRRRFLGAMIAVAAAPMIVRASSLMAHVPVRPNPARTFTVTGLDQDGNRIFETITLAPEDGVLTTSKAFSRIDTLYEQRRGVTWQAYLPPAPVLLRTERATLSFA